ncbi:MAG: hypothetical protein JSU95_14765 [Betaproteobacteria bacterium]|nr:MAG: hypothetical protein JSU95_14765 [Betaproteobacteria bacterium]
MIALGTMTLSPQAAALELEVEALIWEPTGQDVVLGSEAIDPPFGNDLLNFGTDTGFGIGIGNPSAPLPWRVRYRDIGFKGDFAADHGAASNFIAALDHPDNAYGTYRTISANGKIDLRILDADMLIPINTGTSSTLKFFTGLRYVSYEDDLNANYDAGGQIVTRKAENGLFGVRVGLEAKYPLGGGFSLGGHGAISMLMGESSFSQTESFSGYQRNLDLDSTVPAFEAGVRLNYDLALAAQRLELWVGYELIQFDNVVSAQTFVDDTNDAAQIEQGVSAGFRGFTVGLVWTF